jgi:2-amino-4-hydroxy-6-hydroxymethyldihydropteridine diphosphokinase
MAIVYLSLGSNTWERRRNMDAMLHSIKAILLPPIRISKIMETEPLEVLEEQREYLNCIVSGVFKGTAIDLLDKCQAIELALGRLRPHHHASRSADIDILLFGNLIIREDRIVIPHPRLMFRRFCLQGLQEINPDLILPGENISIGEYYTIAGEIIKNQKIKYVDE